ncbi:hypothetical protein Scep_026444 [Stephania cephalantha]|uniref:Uncharacterized protein n=1 Tax=Stephania cephalantha TaxID=152367 RepID=A0AAP0EK52_9MAGN
MGEDHQRRQEASSSGDRRRFAAVAGGRGGGGSALNPKESPQRSNDRRNTDHGRRTTDLTCARREMDAEAVAGEKKTKRELNGMDGGWGLKLGIASKYRSRPTAMDMSSVLEIWVCRNWGTLLLKGSTPLVRHGVNNLLGDDDIVHYLPTSSFVKGLISIALSSFEIFGIVPIQCTKVDFSKL